MAKPPLRKDPMPPCLAPVRGVTQPCSGVLESEILPCYKRQRIVVDER